MKIVAAFQHKIKRIGLESARAALCKWSPCTRQTFLQTLLQTRQTNIHSAELKSYFRPWKLNSPFSVSQSIQLHIRVLVLIPCHRCEKSARESRNFHHLTTQLDNIRAETHDMCVDLRGSARIYVVGMARSICSKNRKIVPYHRYAPQSLIMAPTFSTYQLCVRQIWQKCEGNFYALLFASFTKSHCLTGKRFIYKSWNT